MNFSTLLMTTCLLVVIIVSASLCSAVFAPPPRSSPLLHNLDHPQQEGSVKNTTSPNCDIIVAPCDNTWASRFNQTFAFQAAGPYVQLKTFWQSYVACIGTDDTSPLNFYYSVCQKNTSLWSYGPSAIQTYVYYNNTNNMCLTRSKAPISGQNTYSVDLQPCCLNEKSQSRLNPPCTRENVERQMWLENPSTTQPYNRINSMLLEKTASKSGLMCLTRVSDSCGPPAEL